MVSRLKKLMPAPAGIKLSERTVARDLVIAMTMVITVAFLSVGLLSFAIQTHSENKELRGNITATTSNLASILSLPVWTFNDVEINAIVRNYSIPDDITGITIVDEKSKPIRSVKKDGKSRNISSSKDIIYKGRKIGRITVYSSTTPLYRRAFANLVFILALALVAILSVSFLVMPVLDKLLHQPVTRLISGIQLIAKGNYQKKLPMLPQLDLSRISREFNAMAQEISLRETQIKQSMESSTILRTELSMAETIQRSMTASKGLLSAERVAQFYQPVNNLSGDWMAVVECDKGRHIYALVGDVTGHGIPQGLVTMAALGAIQTLKPLIQQNSKSFAPSTILNILRSTLLMILHECQLAMTVSVLKIDTVSRKVTMSSAGHPFPLIVRNAGDRNMVRPISAPAQSPLGFEFLSSASTPPPYEDSVFEIQPEDMICLFSDGLTEATGNNSRAFHRPFINLLKSFDRKLQPHQLLDKVMDEFHRHLAGGSCGDDVCVVIIDTKRSEKHDVAA